ncbi:MAG: hypothetical protein KC621_16205 [Myxococcales bacterium]|nr:hypothetical protein [Myxococcales bacterium]
MIALTWFACGSGGAAVRPVVDTDRAWLRVEGEGLTLDGTEVLPWSALEADPTDEVQPALVTALEGASKAPLWFELPADTPFWKLRKLVGSAKEAEHPVAGLAVAGQREQGVSWRSPARYGLAGTCSEPVPVTGVEPLVTLSIQSGADGAWVVATATFLPVTAKGPVDGYDDACLAVPACDALYPAGPLREACLVGEAKGGERRVELGGEHGCVLPIARQPEQVDVWRTDLVEVSQRLGLADRPLVVVMPEARIRLDALVAVMGGLTAAGAHAPVGSTMLVEGNDGPPVCTATVRDRASFEAAGARWLGGRRHREETAQE